MTGGYFFTDDVLPGTYAPLRDKVRVYKDVSPSSDRGTRLAIVVREEDVDTELNHCLSRRICGSASARRSRQHSGGAACDVSVDLMTPEAEHGPVDCSEILRLPHVAGLIALDLCVPIGGVGGGALCAARAAVPEASVHEYRHARSYKHKVWTGAPCAALPPPSA